MDLRVPPYRVDLSPVRDQTMACLGDILFTGMCVLGKYTEEFEMKFAGMIGRKYGIAVSSDSAALELVLRVLKDKHGWNDDTEVLLPSMSFFGCVNAILRAGLKPVTVDISIDNGASPIFDKIKEKIKESQIAVYLSVYTAGYVPYDFGITNPWLSNHGIFVVEDCAHCQGFKIDDRHAGELFSYASCWSFFATKIVTTLGEGGMILTDDKDFADTLKVYRNYGRGQRFGTGLAEARGYNWRITEIQAACGSACVDHWSEFFGRRKEIAKVYDTQIATPDLTAPFLSAYIELAYYRYIRLLPQGFDKLEFKRIMREKYGVGLQGDVYEVPVEDQKIFEDIDFKNVDYPQALEWSERHICLPIYSSMTDEQVSIVVDATLKTLKEMKEGR